MSHEVLELIYAAADDIEARSATGEPLQKSPETPLLSGSEGVDSLTLVNLVVAIEERLYSSTGKTVTLVDEDSLAQEKNPFRNIGTLSEYVERLMNKTTA